MTLDEAIAKAKADGDTELAEWLREARGADASARWFTRKLQEAHETTRNLRAENAKLRELFYEAWDWMQRARYDRSIREDEVDEIGVKAIRLGFPDYELGIEVD